MEELAAVGIARLVDFAFTALEAGIARGPIVEKVREMEASGATPEEITEALQAMRQASEKEAQDKIDQLPG